MKVEKLLSNATEKGAHVVLGGSRVFQSTCFKPTLLTNVTADMDITHTEIFGPIIAIQKLVNFRKERLHLFWNPTLLM